jgi:hypothetical protein
MQVLQAVDKKIDVYANTDVFTNKLPLFRWEIKRCSAYRYQSYKRRYSKAGAAFHDISGLTAITPSIKAIAEIIRASKLGGFDRKLKQKT